MAKLSEQSPDFQNEYLGNAFRAAHEAHAAGTLAGRHPSNDVSRWIKEARGEKEIDDQPTDDGSEGLDPATVRADKAAYDPSGLFDKAAKDSRADYQLTADERNVRNLSRRTNRATVAKTLAQLPGYGRLK